MGRLLLRQSVANLHPDTNWYADILNYLNISCDRLLELDSNQLQQGLINYTININRKLSPSDKVFCSDFGGINWIKAKKVAAAANLLMQNI